MADPKHSYGTKVSVELVAGSGVYSDIPKVFDFGDPPVPESGKLDVTNADSLDFTKEYIDDWKEPPEITLKAHWISGDAVQEALIADSVASPKTKRSYRKTYSNGKIRQFTAYPTVKEGADLKGALTLEIKLTTSGASTLV